MLRKNWIHFWADHFLTIAVIIINTRSFALILIKKQLTVDESFMANCPVSVTMVDIVQRSRVAMKITHRVFTV